MSKLQQILIKYDFEFNKLFYDRVGQFVTLLQQWGKIHNLTAQLQTNQIYNNIVDSIYPLKFIDSFSHCVDVGTGAGYPGMILAIANPNIDITLVEPRTKRVAFLNFVKNSLKLHKVNIIQDKVENITLNDIDLVVSRAVTNTNLLLQTTKNISNSSTRYLFYKGSLCQEEIKQLNCKYQIINYDQHRNYLYIISTQKGKIKC